MFRRFLFFCLILFFFQTLQAQDIGVGQLRALDPTLSGTGVKVAQPEASVDTSGSAWEVNPSSTGTTASFFTYRSQGTSGTLTSGTFPNSIGSESYHANQVGDIFYGKTNPSSPEGIAYGVSHVDSYSADYFYNNLIANSRSIAGKVANQSFIFSGQVPIIDAYYDNYVTQHNTIFCSGAGNGGNTNSPSTCYNGIGVAAYGGSSSVGPTSDGRSKPDITAPAGATSYSTPQVSGAAAILVEAGGRLGGSAAASATDSRTVKALLLNGAAKQPGWTHSAAAPLDTQQGAGVLNIYNSYLQFAAGKLAFTASNANQIPPIVSGTFNATSGWDFNSLTSSTGSGTVAVNHYFFDLNSAQASAFTVTSTLVWLRQNQPITTDTNNQTVIVPNLNNLDLNLYNSAGTLIASSVSTVDNVEHLFTSYLAPGRYDLEVVKRGGTVGSNDVVTNAETYALAFNFAASGTLTISISTSGNDVIVTFPSIAGHTYRVERSSDLATWTTLSDNIAGTGSTISIPDSNALVSSQPKEFYRVKVLE